MPIPLPENIQTAEKSDTSLVPEKDSTNLSLKDSGALTLDEASFILDSTLKGKHRGDEKVVAFIDSFVRCKSISQASAEAGVHRTIGYKWRNAKDIANAIQKLTDRSHAKYGFDGSEIVERVKEAVDFDPIDVQRPDGTYISNLHEIPPEARRNIKKMKVRNLYKDVEDMNGMKTRLIVGEVIEYEFYDKLKAAELVGKEKKLFKTTTKVEHDVTENMAEVLLASKQRAEQRVIKEQPDIVTVEYTEKGE